jgi:hypothetical protein
VAHRAAVAPVGTPRRQWREGSAARTKTLSWECVGARTMDAAVVAPSLASGCSIAMAKAEQRAFSVPTGGG